MNKKTLLFISLVCLLPFFLSALEKKIELGGKNSWKEILSMNNISFQPGKGGYPEIILKDGEYIHEIGTDLLLHFNNSSIENEGFGFKIADSYISITTMHSVFGGGSAVFQKEPQGIVLKPGENTLFSFGKETKDFSIEFWLYPATLEEGETIFLWKGDRLQGNSILPQEVRCSISGRKILWYFKNYFTPPSGGPYIIELTGNTALIPRIWHHHLIRFDSSTGLIEYLLDGIPEAVTYTSISGKEDGTIFFPENGNSKDSSFVIGKDLSGLLDEFRVSRIFIGHPFLNKYRQNTGTMITKIFDLEYTNSRIIKIDSIFNTPGSTDVYFYYTVSDTRYADKSLPGKWNVFYPGALLSPDTRGRYIQIMLELFPDGNVKKSPEVSDLTIFYEPDMPPIPPAGLFAVPGDGKTTLTWEKVSDSDISGYKIYYGDSPGQYFGTGIDQGNSPIDAGSITDITLTGLSNGKLYYFTVVSYDSAAVPHKSSFSREIPVRSSKIFREIP